MERAEHNHAAHEHAHGHEHSHGHEHAHEHEHSHDHGHDHAEGPIPKTWGRVITGGVIMAAGMILEATVHPNVWVMFAIYFGAYVILGLDVLVAAFTNIAHGEVFDENFLMTVATLGTFALGIWQQTGDFAEACAVMLFYQIGELLTDQAVDKSRESITKLMDIRPDYANLLMDGTTRQVNPETVEPGQVIVVKPGEKVPLDSVVIKGTSTLNTAALTGESMPRDIGPGSQILAGCVNGSGLLEARVEQGFAESSASKILDIMQNASSKKAKTEKFITRFAKYYTPIVCAAALIVALVPPLAMGGSWETWVYRALLFLVISCPCALVVSVPLTYFSGIGAASRNGILVKGATDLEKLREVTEIVFDKTGTLTQGTFTVRSIIPAKGLKRDDVLAAAASAERDSSHPIAKSVLAAYGLAPSGNVTDEQEIAGQGITLKVDGVPFAAGNEKLMRSLGVAVEPVREPGTVLYIAKDGRYLGAVLIADTVKPDAASVIRELHDMRIRTAMLTGDNCAIGQAVGSELGVGETYCELLPQNKVEMLEKISGMNTCTAFVGDGINDAPVLATADLGIAMGGVGSDAAIEAADVVLMHDKLTEIPVAVEIAKKTRKIVMQNIIFALAVKVIVMILGVLGDANMWMAVFADVGVTLIAVLNSLRALGVKRTAA